MDQRLGVTFPGVRRQHPKGRHRTLAWRDGWCNGSGVDCGAPTAWQLAATGCVWTRVGHGDPPGFGSHDAPGLVSGPGKRSYRGLRTAGPPGECLGGLDSGSGRAAWVRAAAGGRAGCDQPLSRGRRPDGILLRSNGGSQGRDLVWGV